MPVSSPLHQKLKDATAHAHDAIEANVRLKRLLADDLSEAEYRSILSRYYGYFAPLEARLSQDPRFLLGRAEDRFRSERLRTDLVALGCSEEQIARLPLCEDLPEIDSVGEAAGVLYVVEGSVLGGRLIAKHLREFSFFTAATSHFFEVDPQTLASGWKEFLAALAEVDDHNDESVRAAGQTFTTMNRWMAGA